MHGALMEVALEGACRCLVLVPVLAANYGQQQKHTGFEFAPNPSRVRIFPLK